MNRPRASALRLTGLCPRCQQPITSHRVDVEPHDEGPDTLLSVKLAPCGCELDVTMHAFEVTPDGRIAWIIAKP